MRYLAVPVLFAALTACTPPPVADTGRADYQALCSACHGPEGKGDGIAAEGLARAPADLTQLAARNGGAFDRVAVMSHIDGYTRGDSGQIMPDFGEFLQGETVLIDTGDGVLTPTPARLVALADYLATLQAGG